MLVIWPVIIAMALGVLCGTWIPVLAFTVIAMIASIGSAIVIGMAGFGIATALLNLVAVAVALQVGYVVGILVQLIFARITPRQRRGVVRYEHEHDSSLP